MIDVFEGKNKNNLNFNLTVTLVNGPKFDTRNPDKGGGSSEYRNLNVESDGWENHS